MRRWLLLAPLLLLLSACAPVAGVIGGLVERNDGAALTYVLRGQEGGPGLAFDPGPAQARGVIIRAEGDDLALLSVPKGATCTVVTTKLDCRLGTVAEPVIVGLSGGGVVASATWRRNTATVYHLIARPPEGE